jgi:hypothetical protein
VTGFNALDAECRRDLFFPKVAGEQSNSLHRIRTTIEKSLSMQQQCQAGSEDEFMDVNLCV